ATEAGAVKATFTVRNTTTLVEKTQPITVNVNQSVFSFDATATANNQTVNTPVNVNLLLSQTGSGTMTYTMVFNTSSTGTFTYGGTTYTAGQPIPMSLGASFGTYKGAVAGVHNVTFTVTNSNNLAVSDAVAITYVNNDFSLATSGDGSLIVNNTKDLNVFLSQLAADPSITYQVKYAIASGSTGTGELRQNGNVVPMGSFTPISLGNNAITFKGTGAGTVNLEVSVKDSNNVTKSSTIVLVVNSISFAFTGAPQINSIFMGGTTNLNFDISETSASGTGYEMKYVITQGNAEIKNGSEAMNANQWYPVNIGTFSRIFNATEAGAVKATFTVRNTTTLVEKTQAITVNVNQSVFSFDATATANNQTVNTPVNVNMLLGQTGAGTMTYTMVFNTSSSGTFTYAGTTYTAGQPIPMSLGASFGTYKGAVAGVHNVTFTVTNSNNLAVSDAVAITYVNNDFSLATSGDGSLIVNNTKDLNVFLSQLAADPSITYQVKYAIASGSTGTGELRQNGNVVPMGSFTPISLGNNAITFKGTGAGTVNLEVSVKDSNNVTKSSTIVLVVNSISFAFTGAPQINSIFMGGTTNLNFDISETSASGTGYEMKYVITQGNAEIKNGSEAMNANQWYPVNIGTFSRIFNATEAGAVKATFTVRNTTTLVEKTQPITVNVNQSVFSFDATATANNQTVNTPVNVNLLLSQTGSGTMTYTMVFNTSSTGTFTYGGTTYTAGQPIPMSLGASFGTYKGAVAGVHNVTFTVTNSNNLAVSDAVAITYVNNDFSLATSGDGSLIVNNTKDLNVFLSQLAADPSITYQVKYSIASGSTGTGELRQNGNIVPMGVFSQINLGNSVLNFKGLSEGSINLEVTVKDSNGVTHISRIVLNVNAISYTFTGAPQNNTVLVDESTNLNFDVSETSPSGTTYEYKYALTQGNAMILNGAQELSSNTWYPINIGSSTRIFKGIETGTVKILFTTRNTVTLVEKTQVITVNVEPSVFTFSATATTNNQLVSTPVSINFNLNQTGGAQTAYSMTYVSSLGGTFTYAGVTYTAGQVIPFVQGNSTGIYKGTAAGVHSIVFTVRNPRNETKNATVALTYQVNEFNLNATGSGNVNLNTSKDFNTFISQTVTDPSITYQVKFTTEAGTTGSGNIRKGGNQVVLGTYQSISSGLTQFAFDATSAGNVVLKIEVKDSNNIVKTVILNFAINAIDFSIATSGDGSLFINATRPMNVFLSQLGNDPSISYQVKYSYASGTTATGQVLAGENNIVLGQYSPITIGATSLNFKGTSSGIVKLLVEIRDSNNIVHSSIVQFTITQPDYTFSGSAQQNSIYVGGNTNLNFDITETVTTGSSYEMKYVITDGNGIVKNGLNTLNANQWYPVNLGGYSWNLSGIQIGDVKMQFTTRNTTTLVQKVQNIDVNVSNSSFVFNATGTSNNQNVGTSIPVNFNLTQVGGGNITYQMKYTTTGNGVFVYNGITYTAGQPIPIILGASSGNYVGSVVGPHNLVFTVSNNNVPIVNQTATVQLIYGSPDFTLSTSGDGSLVLNAERSFNVFLSQPSGNPTTNYKLRFSFENGTTGSGSITKNGVPQPIGTWITPYELGNQTYSFRANSVGSVRVKVDAEDGFGTVKSSVVIFNISQIDYTFTATVQNNSIFIGNTTNLNMNINENNQGGTYELRYEINNNSIGQAEIKFGNTVVQPGVYVSVPTGNFSWTINGIATGAMDITLYVRNNTGVIKSKEVEFQIKPSTFNFVSTPTVVNMISGQETTTNHLIDDVQGPNSNFTFSYDITNGDGIVKLGNTAISENTWYNVSVGSFLTKFTPSVVGTSNITFRVKNGDNVIKTTTVTYIAASPAANPTFNLHSKSITVSPPSGGFTPIRGTYKFSAVSNPASVGMSNYSIYHFWTRTLNGVSTQYAVPQPVTGSLVNNQEITYVLSLSDLGNYTVTNFRSEIHVVDNSGLVTVYTVTP
ncbi:hypothetical protein, partial [uncultured Flavobacterium sp.]|uniref:beta strand repeat-containing protein n=1 Tax=uncultured Flavobacterium sp. TaxID=165435 RepID=UPI00259161E9